MKKRNGNGNGNAHGGNGDVSKDPVSLQILALYVVQKLGQGTLTQVQTELREKLKLEIHQNTLEIALDALRKRGFLSLNHGSDDEGNRLDLFGIRNLKFQAPPEVAHYSDLLPELLKTPEAEAIKAGLDEKEHQGETKEKASRLGYRDYYLVKARFRTLDPILGGMPKSPYLDKLLRMSENKVDADVFFDRDSDGAFVITSDQVAGWLRGNIRIANKGDVSIYIGCSPAKFVPEKGRVEQIVLPVISQGKGCGLIKYEAVRAGVEFDITFNVPAHGVMSLPEFRSFLMLSGLQPIRGLSPARGKRYGRMLLIGFDSVRDTRNVKAAIEMALHTLPEELRKQYESVISEHLDAADGLRLASKGGGEAEA